MNTTQQSEVNKKAHADSTGFLELLNSLDAATRQGQA